MANLSPTPTTGAGDNPASGSEVAYGLEVFKSQYCGICHQLDVANTAGLFGPPQNKIGLTAVQRIQDPDYTGTATTASEYIRESIVSPDIYLVPGFEYSRHRMPAFTHLTQVEVEALVQLLLHQK